MTALYIDTMERVVMPTVLAVCWQLLFSSLLYVRDIYMRFLYFIFLKPPRNVSCGVPAFVVSFL